MQAGLVGYAQSGKTTLFNALTGLHRGGAAARGHVNLGAIKVPDPRIDALSAIFKPKKTTYAEMRFVDVPGPPGRARASGADALNALADVDAFCLVRARLHRPRRLARRIPCASSSTSTRSWSCTTSPSWRSGSSGSERSTARGRASTTSWSASTRSSTSGGRCAAMTWSDAEEKELAHFGFLSRRPMLVGLNVAEEAAAAPAAARRGGRRPGAPGAEVLVALRLGGGGDRGARSGRAAASSSRSLGLTEPARARFIRAAYQLLDLISYLHRGRGRGARLAHPARRPRAPRGRADPLRPRAGVHPRRGDALRRLHRARAASRRPASEGKLRLEGKEYVVKDGDILNIRFAV